MRKILDTYPRGALYAGELLLFMIMKSKCDRAECHLNEDGKCISIEERECELDIFRCRKCGHQEMRENPLETEKCPNCSTINWDIGEIKCGSCGYEWYPRSYDTKTCPDCGRRLKKI